MLPDNAIASHPMFGVAHARNRVERFFRVLGLKWFYSPPWLRALNRRETTVSYGPLLIYMETASGCNLRCPMCPTGAGEVTRPHGLLKMDLVEKLLGELRHEPDFVGLWMGGEPLLNPHLHEIVRAFSSKGLKTALHTNATLLDEGRSRQLIEAGLSLISFSFDGATAGEYEAVRRGAKFEETLENVRGFLRAKRELGSPLPWTVIQTVLPYSPGNVRRPPETPAAIRALFDGLGVDQYLPLTAHSWAGQMAGVDWTEPEKTRKGIRIACRMPYTDLTIAWNGDALPCCADLGGKTILGNLYRENLYDLWNNAAYRALRRAIHGKGIEKHPLCGGCERLWSGAERAGMEIPRSPLRYRMRF